MAEPVAKELAPSLAHRLVVSLRAQGLAASSGDDFMARALGSSRRPNPKVLILGSYGVGNTGDEAILAGVLRWIRAARPEASIFVPSRRRPDLIRQLHRVASAPLFSLQTLRQFLTSQALVVGGGSLFDREMPPVARLLPLFVILARLLGKKVILTSLGFYRGYPQPARLLAQVAFALAAAASVRDPASLRQTGWARRRRTVEVVPDPSIDLTPTSAEECRQLLSAEGIDGGAFLVGLQLRYLKDEAVNRRMVAEVAQAADALIERLGAQVVFFPLDRSMTVVGPNHGDHVLAGAVRAAMRRPEGFRALQREDYTPAQLKGMIGQTRLFIGMRLIPLVFSHSLGVPTVAIPYSDKVSSFLHMLGEEGIPPRQLESQRLVLMAETALARPPAPAPEI